MLKIEKETLNKINNAFEKLGTFIVRFRVLFLILTAAFLIAGFIGIKKLKILW